MSLNDLSASELARIDAICLEYESRFRSGKAPPISDVVASHGGDQAEELRTELELVREELEGTELEGTELKGTELEGTELERTELEGTELEGTSASGSVPTTDFGTGPSKYFDQVKLPSPGAKIGPYVIGEMLGRGGMGVVFAAIDTRLDRKVAIKMLAVEIAKRRDLTERFEREARTVAAISHPNIVELFDVGVTDGLPYAVMEYLDGELLDARLQRGAIAADEVRRIGAQIADALATAHKAGVVHRDLKPHNIMLVPRGDCETDARTDLISDIDACFVKLFDFGLSRTPRSGFGSAEETGDGVVLGTPGYMAPEQARGEDVTPSADIFSLGCVLYEAFYGERAFDGRTKATRFSATLNHEPTPDPVRRRDDVELADLIQDCLQKEASERPQSAAMISRQLRQRGPVVHPISEQIRAGHAAGELTRRRMLALVGGGAAGAILGAVFLRGDRSELASIGSIAVLSFTDDSSPSPVSTTLPPPVGDAQLHRGEKLSSLLVHELTRLSEVKVPRFRPLVAETPSEFREIGTALEVDALLAGNMRTVKLGTKEWLELDIQIVSAKTGNQIWGKQIQSESGDNMLQQTKLATEIASVIGQRLTSTADEAAPPNVESFSCLVDGKTRSDPDSLAGLEMALRCFKNARDVDRRFADPVAGIALTSITLAAQTGKDESIELVLQSRESAKEALQLDPNSIDARLAVAMVDWQTVGRYLQADRAFQELVMVAPNNWQVRHQYGLLQLATGRLQDAAKSLREASQLNPMSVLAKVDVARAHWFSGNQERAIADAVRIRDKHDNSPLARGLLVDIYEHQSRYEQAAAEHDSFDLPAGAAAENYFRERRGRLLELPYGPFGEVGNAAILQARTPGGIDDLAFAELIDPMPPMLPLLIAAHPSFGAVRLLPRAKEILPSE